MDPLSVTASDIAVATLAAQIASTICKLRAIYQLPGRLHAISNEVSDLEVVLQHVATIVVDRQLTRADEQIEALSDVVQQADRKLVELNSIVQRLLTSCIGNGKFLVRAKVWIFEKENLRVLQDDIHTIKASLNIMLGATHTHEMTRIQLDLQSISLITTEAAEKQVETHQVLQETQQLVDGRLAGLERMLLEQFARLQSNYNSEMGPGFLGASALAKSPPKPYSSITPPEKEEKNPGTIRGVSVQVTQYTGMLCPPRCGCNCHSTGELRSSSLVRPVVGYLFVGYIGHPRLRKRCDAARCRRKQAPRISIEYFFPLWFLARILILIFSYGRGAGPQIQLRTLRLVPDSAQSITYVLNGNIEGLKYLFSQGLASPNDVSQGRQYSLLRWAVHSKQIYTCKFLADAGADPDHELQHAQTHTSSDRLWDFVLRGKLNKSEEGAVRGLLERSDYIEDQHFPPIHRIVLGTSLRSLEEELTSNHMAVFETEAQGRTALCWAAARGDDRSTVILLSHGADPNVFDINGITPVYLAANEGRSVCARLLLEAGASPDPIPPSGVPKRSSPLLCAAGNDTPVITMKTLVDFGADIEAISPDGETPLCAVARMNTATHALYLIENNANLNALTNDGKTPLTIAIAYNNHDVLDILLDRWNKYDTCPRLTGPHLLSIVADFAAVKTIRILSRCEHLQLRGDRNYALAAQASERIRNRANASEEVVAAFDELILVISKDLDLEVDAMLESGILRSSTASSSSSEYFQDSFETIDIEDQVEIQSTFQWSLPSKARTF